MPPDLRFVKGWPPRVPTIAEAERIALARAPLLRRHGLDNRYPDARAVRQCFAELLDAKADKARPSRQGVEGVDRRDGAELTA